MPRITLTTSDGHKQRYELSLDMDVVTVGRDASCDIAIADPTVSSIHAEIRRMKGGFCIVDCDSTGGITVEGTPVPWIEFTNGLTVQLGSSTLHILYTDPEIIQLLEEKNAEEASAPVVDATQEPHADSQYEETQQPVATPAYDSPVEAPVIARPRATPAALNRPGAGGVPGSLSDSPARPAGMASSGYQIKHEKGGGFAYIFALILICAFALIAGMTLRHYEETGGLLFNDLFSTEKPKEEPKKEEPKKEEPKEEPKKEEPKEEPKKDDSSGDPAPVIKAPKKERDIMDKALKSNGEDTLPTVDQFLIP